MNELPKPQMSPMIPTAQPVAQSQASPVVHNPGMIAKAPTHEQVQANTMDFYEAIKQVMQGKKVARIGWHNKDFCYLNKNDWFLTVYREEKGGHFLWNINEGDLVSKDWVVIE